MKSIHCNHLFVSNSLKRFRLNYKRVIASSVSETTFQLCSESTSLCSETRYSETTILRRCTHFTPLSSSVLSLWVFKATLSYNEKGEVKTRIWGHTWGSETRNLPYSERIRIRKNDTDRDGISFSIFLQWPIYLINSVDKTKSLQKKTTQKPQPSIDAMQIILGVTGSLSKWTVSPKEFNRIRFLIYYIVNMCP